MQTEVTLTWAESKCANNGMDQAYGQLLLLIDDLVVILYHLPSSESFLVTPQLNFHVYENYNHLAIQN